MVTRESQERQVIQESVVKAVIQELKGFLDTREFRDSLATAVSQVLADTPDIQVKADIQVCLDSQELKEQAVIQVSKGFPVTLAEWEIVVIRALLDSAD